MGENPEIKDKIDQIGKAADKPTTEVALQTFIGMQGSNLTQYFSGVMPAIANVLSKASGKTPEKIIATATQILVQNPKIMSCTRASFLGAVMQAAILDFDILPQLGNCYFVPYNRNIGTKQNKKWIQEIQFQIGYRGWVTLVRRSKNIANIDAFEVVEGDDFEVTLGLTPNIMHRRNLGIEIEPNGQNLTFVYAFAEYENGIKTFKVLSKAQVENLRQRSPSQSDGLGGAWFTDYPAMAKGKVLKQLCKLLPLEDSIKSAITADEAVITPKMINAPESYQYPNAEGEVTDNDGKIVQPDDNEPSADDIFSRIEEEAKKNE